MAGGGGRENVICFLILRLPDLPKNIRVFWKLFCSTLKQKALPARRAGAKQGGLYVLNDLFYVIRLIWLLIDLKNNRFSLLGSCLWKAEDCKSECAFIESDETLFFGRSATSYRLSLQ